MHRDLRRRFTPDRLDALLDFCQRQPATPVPPALRRRMMTRLTTDVDGVIELVRQGETVAVAVTIDGVRSVADCAVLDLLGGAADAAPMLDAAEAFVARGPRAGLEVPLTRHTAHWRSALEARGYRLAYTSYEMRTPARPAPDPPPMPGPGWSWAIAGVDRAAGHHAVVSRAMGPVPGAFRAPLSEFTDRLSEGLPDELLLCGERIAGFVAIGGPGDGVGHIDLIGRDPDFRGCGLGPILLARAMARLSAAGARRFALDVTASNTAALALYRRYGFDPVEQIPVYRRLGDR